MTQVSDLSPLSGADGTKEAQSDGDECFRSDPAPNLDFFGGPLFGSHRSLSGLSPPQVLNRVTDAPSFLGRRSPTCRLSHSLTALQKLRLASTQVTDPSPLQSLTALKELDLSGTKIGRLTPLQTLAALEILNLSETKLTDLCPLGSLTSLQSLDLRGMAESLTLSPLKSLTALQSLDICQTKVADLSPLKSLTALQKLSADNLALTDLSPTSLPDRSAGPITSLDVG